MDFAQVLDELLNKLLQRRKMNIIKPLDINARPPQFVLSEFLQELKTLLRASHNIECQVIFSRRETDQTGVPFFVFASTAQLNPPSAFGQ